jgi:hypothetical protein
VHVAGTANMQMRLLSKPNCAPDVGGDVCPDAMRGATR